MTSELEIKVMYPRLWSLLNATFHADWREEGQEARVALVEALGGYPEAALRAVQDELERVLRMFAGDAGATAFIAASGADLWMEEEFGSTGKQFLTFLDTWIATRLGAGSQRDEQST